MQHSEEMSKVYWRHGTTVHMRFFELSECRAIQWWHDTHTGVIYLAKGAAFNPEFDGTILTCERQLQHSAALPDIPKPIDVQQFHRDLEACRPSNASKVLENTRTVSKMLDLVDSTSSNEIERTLRIHRTKRKLQAVARFKKN